MNWIINDTIFLFFYFCLMSVFILMPYKKQFLNFAWAKTEGYTEDTWFPFFLMHTTGLTQLAIFQAECILCFEWLIIWGGNLKVYYSASSSSNMVQIAFTKMMVPCTYWTNRYISMQDIASKTWLLQYRRQSNDEVLTWYIHINWFSHQKGFKWLKDIKHEWGVESR